MASSLLYEPRKALLRCPECGTANRVPVGTTGVPRCGRCQRDLAWSVEADETTFDAAVRTRLPVLVEFWAPWCGPCKVVAPAVELISRDLAGRLKVVKVNIEAVPALSARYHVQGVPTLLLLRGGVEIGRHVGAVSAPQLRQWLRVALDRHRD